VAAPIFMNGGNATFCVSFRSVDCKRQWWSRSSRGQWSCSSDESSQSRASHLVVPPSWPCGVSWSEPSACASDRERNACGHGCASARPGGCCAGKREKEK